jgi:hypothetical protein
MYTINKPCINLPLKLLRMSLTPDDALANLKTSRNHYGEKFKNLHDCIFSLSDLELEGASQI